jgi:T-complex protein 1 subunit zeta
MVTVVNSKADVLKATQALAVNLNAAKGLQEVMKTNLGPRGTLKMLVGGAGQIKITKDGHVLLGEMQIQHPTASMIARAASAQDDITGDGTTSSIMFIGELMKLSESYISDGLHPRIIAEGFDLARTETLKFLDGFKVSVDDIFNDRERLVCVARSSLRTKIAPSIADPMAEAVVDAVRSIKRPNEPIDLHMVEIMHMKHKLVNETRLIKGLVMDHGARHPDMPKRLENCYILTCNVSLEYEKSEVNAGFFYSSSEQRDKLAESERKFTDDKVRKIIELKRHVCTEDNKKTFVLINQKGIDPPSLEMLARENIIALRRAKRRNMERLPLVVAGTR